MGSFQGHKVAILLGEIFNSLWIIPILALSARKIMPKIGKGMKFWDYFFVYSILLIIPNSTYAMFEIRHLLVIDKIADSPDIWSFIVFGGISLIGFLTTIYGNRIIINYYSKTRKERWLISAILSLACSFGAVVGILNFSSIDAILFPPTLIYIFQSLLNQPNLIILGTVCTIFILFSNLLPDFLNRLFIKNTSSDN